MLSQNVINKINHQIEDELRNVDSICSSPQEKMEAIERIAKLKALLTPQPSREEIMSELASALTDKVQQKETQYDSRPSLGDIFADAIRKQFTK
jgi:hypothetical protein